SVTRPVALPNQPVKDPPSVVRLTMELPPESAISIDPTAYLSMAAQFALSPDGSRLVYAGGKEGETKLYLRRMDASEPTELKGTDGAESPFFSPDGQWVGFNARRKLKKIRLGESQPIVVCDAQNFLGASWGSDGQIYFAESATSNFVSNDGLKRVRA